MSTAAGALQDPLQVARQAATGALIGVYIGAGLAAITGCYSVTVPLVIAGAAIGLAVGLVAALLQRHRPLRDACAAAIGRIDRAHLNAWALRAGRATLDGLARFLASGATSHAGTPMWAPPIAALAALTAPFVFGWLSDEPEAT